MPHLVNSQLTRAMPCPIIKVTAKTTAPGNDLLRRVLKASFISPPARLALLLGRHSNLGLATGPFHEAADGRARHVHQFRHLCHRLLPSFIMSSAKASCSTDNALFLPPFRPWALAAVRPALVRSISLSRSNSARAAAMWK